jgi:ubiquinone/menaquinone biosynthesis C-methylase UbiE
MMRPASRRRFVTALAIAAVAGATALAQSARDNAADAARLITLLDIREGSVVGEIGAGGGELTIALAKHVGASGHVYTNELNKDRLAALAKKVEQGGLRNVTAVEGLEKASGFPDQCCDAIFMRNVYHHFGDPPAMNGSLLTSLKPGGRLAVIDFTPPPGGEAAPGGRDKDNHHGITAPTLERELKAAGFEIVSSSEKGRAVTVVAARPTINSSHHYRPRT